MNKIKLYIKPILCAISLIAMFLPFATYSVEAGGIGAGVSFNGLTVAMTGYVSLLLIILPAVSICTMFMPQYSSKKDVVSLVLPVVCILCWIIAFFQIDFITTKVAGNGSDYGVEADTSLSYGAYIMLICYLVLGALELTSLIQNKSKLEELKNKGSKFAGSVRSKIPNSVINKAPESWRNPSAMQNDAHNYVPQSQYVNNTYPGSSSNPVPKTAPVNPYTAPNQYSAPNPYISEQNAPGYVTQPGYGMQNQYQPTAWYPVQNPVQPQNVKNPYAPGQTPENPPLNNR